MIDRNPVVGRILLRDSIMVNGFCRMGGVITKISGNRIYFIKKGRDGGEDYEEYVSKYAAVCDTQAEVDALLEQSERSMIACRELFKKNHKEFCAFMYQTIPDK